MPCYAPAFTAAGASRAGTPTGSRAGTPRAPATAPLPQQQQQARRPASSRLGAEGGDSRLHSLLGEVAIYTLSRTGSRGSAATASTAAGAGRGQAAQTAVKQHQQRRQRAPWGSSSDEPPVPHSASRQTGGGGAKQQRQQQQQRGNARTTPFAPRPNSREAYWPTESGPGGHQQQRPRGQPLYDASTLLPVTGLEGLGDLSSSAYGGGSGFEDLDPFDASAGGGWPPAAAQQLVLTGRGGSGSSRGDRALVAAGGAAGAAESGPLDHLLCQVDRMLHQVERAIH